MEAVTEETPKRGRGRKPKVFSVINDPLFGQYQINKEEDQYVIAKQDAPDKGIKFCNSLSAALVRITELRMAEKAEMTLREYVDEYKAMLEDFKTAIGI